MAQIFVETRRSAASIKLFIDLVACLEPKLWSKKNILLQNQKIAENESPTGGISNSGNSQLEHADELFEPKLVYRLSIKTKS